MTRGESMKRLIALVLSLVFAASGALAAEGEKAEEKAADTLGASVYAIPADATDEQLALISDKMACYVQIINDFGTMGFIEALNERLSDLEKKKPGQPLKRQRQTNGYGGRFDAALKKNAGLLPRMEPADAAMDVIAETYPRLKRNLVALDRYYERGDYKDDGEAKGKELGAEMKKDLAAFIEAGDLLNREFDRLDGTLDAMRLERFEKQYGKRFFWHHSMLMQQARTVLALAPPDMKNFDATAFEAAFKEFKTRVDNYETYIKEAGKDLKKEANGVVRDRWITDFISTCRTLLEAKKENIPRKYTGYVEVLYSSYNNMVNDSNGIQFTMPPQ